MSVIGLFLVVAVGAGAILSTGLHHRTWPFWTVALGALSVLVVSVHLWRCC
jgi:hypothetical protein